MFSFGLLNCRAAGTVLAAVLVFEGMAIAMIVAAERSAQRADEARMSVFQKAGPAWKKRLVATPASAKKSGYGQQAGPGRRTQLAEPIVRPPSVAAGDAKLRPDEMVIGVNVGGKPQAYRFAAFESTSGHLVNDVVQSVPVSVAYCDLTGCLRVYTDSQGSQPLDLNVAGVLNGEMVVTHGGGMYFHRSGREVEPGNGPRELPYALITPTVTTWKEWSMRHPDTRVYIGTREELFLRQQVPPSPPSH